MNQLDENDVKIPQPKNVSIDLMEHQKTAVYAMLQFEKNRKIVQKNVTIPYLNCKDDTVMYHSNFGILADRVGAGKTLMALALINKTTKTKSNDFTLYGSRYFICNKINKSEILKTNLVIVPQKLIGQWRDSLKYFTEMSSQVISSKKEIDKIKNFEDIKKLDIILISNTKVEEFMSHIETNLNKPIRSYKWSRVMIDEVDSISLGKEFYIETNFFWFITATPSALLHRPKPFIKNLLGLFEYEFIKIVQVKNKKEYVEESIKLPKPNRLIIDCLTPKEIQIIEEIVPNHVIEMINAGNMDEAVKHLNCNVDTSDNIFQVISNQLRESIGNANLQLEYEKKKKVHGINKEKKKITIKQIESNIKRLESKLKSLEDKIKSLNEEVCPVCMCDFEEDSDVALLECCNSLYDVECLMVFMADKNTCPMCGQNVNKSMIHIMGSKEKEEQNKGKKKNIKKDKLDVFMDILDKRIPENGRFLVFASHTATFSKIITRLIKNDIKYEVLKGTNDQVEKKVNKFKNGEVPILMLNAKFFGAGLNLQMATDLVLFHRFDDELEEQVIGRAQRLGRTEPLNVYYLLHQNERNPLNNKKTNMKDLDYAEWLDQEETEVEETEEKYEDKLKGVVEYKEEKEEIENNNIDDKVEDDDSSDDEMDDVNKILKEVDNETDEENDDYIDIHDI